MLNTREMYDINCPQHTDVNVDKMCSMRLWFVAVGSDDLRPTVK